MDLPLRDLHRSENARFRDLLGFSVPANYGDVVAEHRAAMKGAGLIDRSMLGKATVTGRDRAAFLQGMLSNDVKGLAPGQGCPAAFLDAHGKVVSLLAVFALADRILLELPAGSTEKFLQAIDKFLISEKALFESSDDEYAIIAVQGPQAPQVLAQASGTTLELAPYAHAEVSIAGAAVRVMARRDAVTPGFHCWTAVSHAEALWKALRAAGAAPVGAEAAQVLRVEAGLPLYGVDVDDSVILPETRLDALVSYTKGCYIGQETVARVKYRGHINRGLTGLVLDGDDLPAPGAAVLAEDREVGRITSAVRSIALGRPIALGYVRREHFEPGAAVSVKVDDALVSARVSALPFVPPA
ncbi:MAG TPA: aminomethyltransferase family protein [Candidatus Bathyarchaeia archaeon]|nr:aminomethyltransferase family protein [Candidatus Bathyarchaeia archaeon]